MGTQIWIKYIKVQKCKSVGVFDIVLDVHTLLRKLYTYTEK